MIQIRTATPEQGEEIAALIMTAMTDDCCLNFCGEGYGLSDFRRMLTSLVRRNDTQYSYQNAIVAMDEDRVVGIAVSYDGGQLHTLRSAFIDTARQMIGKDHSGMDDETQAGELYLDSLAVLPEYRRRGIASRLLKATACRAAAMGLPCVGLLVDKGNPEGEALYTSLGFRYVNDSQWGGHPMKHLQKAHGTTLSLTGGVARHPARRMAKPVTLDILRGEQVAIVGANGSGKSRLVDILTGRSPLLMNEVRYDFGGDAATQASQHLRYISFRDSYGDQDASYYYQQRWNQHDIDDNMPRVDGKPIIALSSGEMRRYQLRKVLASQPRLLMIDNPFIGLDADTRVMLRRLLQQLIEERGMQLILVLSKTDDIPDFITHIIPVNSMEAGAKITLPEYRNRQQPIPLPQLPQEEKEWMLRLAPKKLSEMPFYPQNGGEILRFRHVSIRYGARTILRDLDWTVHEGERWALSGENGAGKSTLLSLVCADNPQAYACDIALFGHRRGSGESIWEIKKHIGYVSPEMHRAYLKDIPAVDIVASGLADSIGLYTRPRPEQRGICLQWMQVFGIAPLADRTFLSLSSGEQRLCLLARAFVKDPELIILDEPLHGLDDRYRQRVREIIEVFCQRPHKTLVMVTHYEEELPPCIDHHLRLKKNTD